MSVIAQKYRKASCWRSVWTTRDPLGKPFTRSASRAQGSVGEALADKLTK